MITVYLDWDTSLKEQDRKNQEIKDLKDNEGKRPQNSPTFLSSTTFTLHSSESSIKRSTKKSSGTPTEEENKCKMLIAILEHKSSKTLEEIN